MRLGPWWPYAPYSLSWHIQEMGQGLRALLVAAQAAKPAKTQARIPSNDMRTSDGCMPGKTTGDLALTVNFKPFNADPDTFANNVSGTAGNFGFHKAGTDGAIPGTLAAGVGALGATAIGTAQTIDPGTPLCGPRDLAHRGRLRPTRAACWT